MIFRLLIAIGALVVASYGQFDLQENDQCNLTNNKKGTCKRISNCPTFDQDSARGEHPNICSFDPIDSSLIICCRPQNSSPASHKPTPKPTSSKKRISERMCEKYGQYAYIRTVNINLEEVREADCGIKEQPLIVGGLDAGLKEFPHMVQIGYGEPPSIGWSCGGSLISDRWVLSAAHCKRSSKGVASWARVGELDHKNDEDGARPQVLRIADTRIHSQYKEPQLYNDIILFKLERALKLNSFIRPICLQVEKTLKGDSMIATGWGHTLWGGRPSSRLQKVIINVVNNRRCRQSYRSVDRTQLPNGIVENSQLCAGNEYNKDTCQGDSGGPLQYANDVPFCTYTQVGITSFGKGCGGGSPGIYTRVSHYIDWIESIVWPDEQ